MEFGFKKLSTKASTTCRQKYGKAAELSSHLVKPRLHDITGCQTGWTTGWTTGCIVSCKQTLNRLFNQFDNRLYRVNGVLHNVSVIKTVTLSKNRTDLVATHVLTGKRKCATSCIVWHFSSDNGAVTMYAYKNTLMSKCTVHAYRTVIPAGSLHWVYHSSFVNYVQFIFFSACSLSALSRDQEV